ncbi:MAG: phage tail baseplate protein, partial [Waterburya sp.]
GAVRRVVRTAYYSSANHINELSEALPLVLDDSTAGNAVFQNLQLYWSQSTRITEVRLPYKYAYLKPGDIVKTVLRGIERLFQITKVDINNMIVEVDMVSYQRDVALPNVAKLNFGDSVELIENPLPYLIDTNLIDDSHPDLFSYIIPTNVATFPHAVTYENYTAVNGAGYSQVTQTHGLNVPNGVGQIQSVSFGSHMASKHVIDRKCEITMSLPEGGMSLTSVTDEDFFNDANLVWIKYSNEIISFRDAVLVSLPTDPIPVYRISHLRRGARGTEDSISVLDNQVGSDIVVLKSANVAVGQVNHVSSSNIDLPTDFKIVPSNTSEALTTNFLNDTPQGNRDRPLAIYNYKLVKL